MEIKSSLYQSALVAIIISLLVPVLWLTTISTSYRTPIVEKGYLEKMSETDRSEWLNKNKYEASFIERMKSLPRLIENTWVGYLQTSLVLFIIIFTLNVAYIIGGNKKPNK